ncbi:MAG: protein-export chaperone SecB [Xanthomonadales bacterium]|nr:protein-export chaperone SecB [Xanthomonadales bacterium]
MAEENQSPEAPQAGAQEQAGAPQFSVQKLYLKDVSFESPGAPGIFSDSGQPELKMNLTQRVQSVEENIYEVVLTVTVTCKMGDKTAYLAEVQQAGIFGIVGFEQEQLQATLGAYCPTILFPYARQQISDLVLHGGFQPLLLQPVNFDQLYAEQLRRQQAQAAEAGNA